MEFARTAKPANEKAGQGVVARARRAPVHGGRREAPPIVQETLRGPGEPLDASTRTLMERRFHHDFAHVRVYANESAAASARAVNAIAYTVGRSIVFDRGRYAPQTEEGRRLLAHEMVHTMQQSQGHVAPGGRLQVDSPGSAAEAEAQRVAPAPAERTLAPAVQRAVNTSGGDWDTDNYDAVQDVDVNGTAVPAAQNVRGADITLRFKPNETVSAELIGLTQSVQSYVAGALAPTPAAATRAIPAADAKPLNTGAGETDEGTAIDRAQGYNNPIYPVQTTPSGSLSDPNTSASWGQLGWRYTDATGAHLRKDATLIDKPRRTGADKNSRQVFEVTALATKGVQAGTFYGSVRWGWRTDGAGALTKVPLQKVSDGVPSSTFLKAAGIWDKGTSSTGAANVKLSAPEIMVTTRPVTITPQSVVMLPIVLPAGTRLEIISGFGPPWLPDTGTVRVVDGPHTGLVGDIQAPGVTGPVMPIPGMGAPALVPERP